VLVFGEGNVITDTPMDVGGEDFAFMHQEKPGCYDYIGNGVGSKGGCMAHNPNYDFNDEGPLLSQARRDQRRNRPVVHYFEFSVLHADAWKQRSSPFNGTWPVLSRIPSRRRLTSDGPSSVIVTSVT
jgi:hypothetical protein